MAKLDLTIVSVCYKSVEFLKFNRQLLSEANKQIPSWIVIKNHPEDILPKEFTKREGVPHLEGKGKNIGAASYHHGAGLNKALRQKFDTRYILLLDPDFFIVPPLRLIIRYIQQNNLSFFGAPYSINNTKKKARRVYDFPCAFCMFIDQSQVDLQTLDFLPSRDEPDLMADTGYKVSQQYKDKNYEIVLPSFRGLTSYKYTKRFVDIQYKRRLHHQVDQYWWKDCLFGLHTHMKVHLADKNVSIYYNKDSMTRPDYERRVRERERGLQKKKGKNNKDQLFMIERTIQKVREKDAPSYKNF